MAIGTLTPKIRACFSESCSKILVYDTTSAYSTANKGGYGDTNILTTSVNSATLAYTTPDGTETTLDVVSNVNAQAVVVGEFLIAEIEVNPNDGEYSFSYLLSDGEYSVVKRYSIYSLCVVRCCVDKLWAKVAANGLGEDCKCTGEKTTALEKAELAQGWYNSIRYGAACNSKAVKDILLTKLQRICKLEKCNCN